MLNTIFKPVTTIVAFIGKGTGKKEKQDNDNNKQDVQRNEKTPQTTVTSTSVQNAAQRPTGIAIQVPQASATEILVTKNLNVKATQTLKPATPIQKKPQATKLVILNPSIPTAVSVLETATPIAAPVLKTPSQPISTALQTLVESKTTESTELLSIPSPTAIIPTYHPRLHSTQATPLKTANNISTSVHSESSHTLPINTTSISIGAAIIFSVIIVLILLFFNMQRNEKKKDDLESHFPSVCTDTPTNTVWGCQSLITSHSKQNDDMESKLNKSSSAYNSTVISASISTPQKLSIAQPPFEQQYSYCTEEMNYVDSKPPSVDSLSFISSARYSS